MIPPTSAQEQNRQDLDWLAFLYVCSELDEATLADFELLLANDQGAQEALTRAVELSATTQLALAAHTRTTDLNRQPASVPLSVRVAQRRRLLVAIASTACAVIGLVGSLFLPDNNRNQQPAGQTPAHGQLLTDSNTASNANSATDADQQAVDLLTGWTELAATSQAPADSQPNLAAITNPDETFTDSAPEQNTDIDSQELATEELATEELLAEQSAVPDWLLTAVAVASANEETFPASLQELPN